ncbi:ADP-ribosylglycohydrolase family protein [Nocardia sp. CNY236]|uniref:ADP-ribosylglycohydrolase family protein n=1 Tax=Nocardia sp. CNY236 TaxID=1169152 RepID=UPI000409118E|nr:ADP-ribosylglycohydrolase family protein [Nocardia sp. CNY236]
MPTTRERWPAVLRGCAYGDAWGNLNEFMSYGQLTAHDKRGPDMPTYLTITDDTQMTLSLARALDGAPDRTAQQTRDQVIAEWVEWLDDPDNHRAPGTTCLRATRALKDGSPWFDATVMWSDGCGTVMRVSPCAFLPDGVRQPAALWQAATTHGGPGGLFASVIAAEVIHFAAELTPGRVVESALDMIHSAESSWKDRVTSWVEDKLPVPDRELGTIPLLQHIDIGRAQVVDALTNAQRAVPAFQQNPFGDDPCTFGGAGWRAHECLATALLCVDAVPDDPKEALRRATVTDGDSDSIAAVAGAILGALHDNPWPAEWFDRLEPRYRDWISKADGYRFDAEHAGAVG